MDELRNNPERFALREKLEERIGRKLDLTPAFAASMERLAKAKDRLTDNEADTLFRAGQKAYEAQGRQLARLFGMVETDVPKLAVLVSCIQNGIGWTDEHYTVALAYKTLEDIVQDIQRCGLEPGLWLSEVKGDIEKFESRIPEGMPFAEQFYALLSHVIARSRGAQTYYEERTERASFDTLRAPALVDRPRPSTLELYGVELPPEPIDADATEQDAGKGGFEVKFADYEILPPEYEEITRPIGGAHLSQLTPMATLIPSQPAPHRTTTFRPEDFE